MAYFLWIVLGIFLVGIISYIIMIFNGLIVLKNNISKSWANIDVLLKQRNDELPNVISSVKGYAKHEREIVEYITKARAFMLNATSLSDKARASEAISTGLGNLFALAENYPKLRANENFLHLQQRISGLENEIADRREFYNDSVTNYNIRIQSFPDLIVAKMLGYKEPAELFKATGEEKKLVKVEMS